MALQIETKALQAILGQFQLNTRLLNNVIEDIPEDRSNFRMKENTNNIKWVIGHILNARYGVAALIGMDDKDPNEDMFGHGKSIEVDAQYPSISSLRKLWNEFSPKFLRRLENITDEDLNKAAPFQLPIEDNSILGAISFFAHHESYHLGQLGIIRKYMDYGPMKYS